MSEKKSKKERAPRTAVAPLDAVAEKYTKRGWQVMKVFPKKSVDLIAKKDETRDGKIIRSKYHFVQVVTPGTEAEAKFGGEERNTFVQNAFSNDALPIHANMRTINARTGELKTKITFRNMNDGSRVLV